MSRQIDGVEAPSVTEILNDLGLGPDLSKADPVAVAYARSRGSGLHLAIRYHHEGDLLESSLHPAVQPGYRAYLEFLRDTEHDPIASELEVLHPAWRFSGHPDRVAWHRRAERALFDWKYVASLDLEYVRLQLAGYRMLWNCLHPSEPVARCFAVQFLPKGGYRLHDVTDPNAEQVFLGALLVWREKHRRRLLKGESR